MQSISSGKESAITSSLTLDEVAWTITKRTGDRNLAINICKDILDLPNLSIVDVKSKDVLKALNLMEKYPHLDPRDAIHVAVCHNANLSIIVSRDNDFDNIQEVDWRPLE